jgi:hypothetical protein
VGNVYFNYDASGRIKRVGCIHDLQPFRFGTRRRIADFTTSWPIVEIVGWVNGYQERELIQINRDNDYEY